MTARNDRREKQSQPLNLGRLFSGRSFSLVPGACVQWSGTDFISNITVRMVTSTSESGFKVLPFFLHWWQPLLPFGKLVHEQKTCLRKAAAIIWGATSKKPLKSSGVKMSFKAFSILCLLLTLYGGLVTKRSTFHSSESPETSSCASWRSRRSAI